MIIAAGLSPAWQQVLVFDGFRPGEVNRAAEAYWCASGKVLNVALALGQLGGPSAKPTLTLATLGGAAYDPIDAEFAELGLPRRWIRTQAPTRVCTTLVDRAAGVATELVENAGPVTPAELTEFEEAFAAAAPHASAVVLTGSLPRGAPPDLFRRLLRHVRAPAVLDIRGPELLAALDERPAVVKPNRTELAATLDRPMAGDDDLRPALADLQNRGARAVLVTAGKDPAWLADAAGCRRFTPPSVDRVVNPVGCGDCLAAGLAAALADGRPLDEAVERGLQAAAANLQTLLPSDFNGRRQQRAAR